MSKRHKAHPLSMTSQYDKDTCCPYPDEGMTHIRQQRKNQKLPRTLEPLADRKPMKRAHDGYATTLKNLLAAKAWKPHPFLSHHNEHKHSRRMK